MKRTLITLLVLIFALSIFTLGCGKKETNLLLATGGTGGTYYPLGGAMAEAWTKHIDGLNVSIQSTGASVENIRLIDSGETELAMAMNGPAMDAYAGKGSFDKKIDFAAVGVIYPEVMQVVAPINTGIKTIDDLKGKRVSIGPAGSGTAAVAVKMLEAYGIDPDKDIDKFQDNFADAATKLKDGLLDAAFAVLAVPAGSIIDVTTSTPVTIVNVQGEGLNKLLTADPTLSAFEIPANTYKGQDGVGYTVSQWAVLYVKKDLPDDIVYQMTKVMYENTAEIAAAHDAGNQITIDNAMKGIPPVPFHPGAEKYYKEVGLK